MSAEFHVAHILCTGGFFVFSHKQNLNSDLDCITQSTLGHTHKQKYTQSLSTVLLHWVAFSFQRDLTSKAGIFYIPKESPNTKHTDASTGTDTHTQT